MTESQRPPLRTIALIPARGGSKGIPRKNLERVGGRSLLARSIAHARAVPEIDVVLVSTDDAEIAAAAEAAGAEVLVRPVEISGDKASTESAVAHALDLLASQGREPEIVVLLQCTSPFRERGQLAAALRRFHQRGCDSMLSAVRFFGFLWNPGQSAGWAPLNYEPGARPRRQDFPETLLETGSFYVFRTATFRATGSRLGGRIEAFEVPAADALEIDDREQLELARLQANMRTDELVPELTSPTWLILDVDGTLTDGAMYYAESGDELKRFDTRDGLAIRRWRDHGHRVAIVTGERSESVVRRARKLDVDHVELGVQDKGAVLDAFTRERGIGRHQIVAMGDDLGDLPMVERSTLFAAPADARFEVLSRADVVTRAPGGHGAVRELVDLLLRRHT